MLAEAPSVSIADLRIDHSDSRLFDWRWALNELVMSGQGTFSLKYNLFQILERKKITSSRSQENI